MARLFFQLKWALLRGRLRGKWQVRIGLLLGLLLVLPLGLGLAAGMAWLGRRTEFGPEAAVLLMGSSAFVWTIGPPLLFGIDETLDPTRLTHLPLTRRQLAVGMTCASALGIGALLSGLIVVGILIGLTPTDPLALVLILGCAVHLAICVFAGRVVTTALSAALRSRRTRDAVGLVIGVMALVIPQVPNLLLNFLDFDPDALRDIVLPLSQFVSLTPFGIAGRAVAAAARGEAVAAVGSLSLAIALAVLLGWAWMIALQRLSTSTESRPATGGAGVSLRPRYGRGLPDNRFGAAAAKELRYYAREPRNRVALVVNVLLSVGLFGFAAIAIDDPRAVLLTAGMGSIFGLTSLNVFGVDGQATQLLILSGGNHRADLAGKNLALCMVALPALVAGSIVVAAIRGGFIYLPVAWLIGAALLLLTMGMGNVSSIQFAFPQPEGANAFAGHSGTGALAGLGILLALIMAGVLSLPILVAAGFALFLSPAWLGPVAVLSAIYGATIWFFGLKAGATQMSTKGPELLAKLQTT